MCCKPISMVLLRECRFAVAGPRAWKSLPAHLHQIRSTVTFKRHLSLFFSSEPIPASVILLFLVLLVTMSFLIVQLFYVSKLLWLWLRSSSHPLEYPRNHYSYPRYHSHYHTLVKSTGLVVVGLGCCCGIWPSVTDTSHQTVSVVSWLLWNSCTLLYCCHQSVSWYVLEYHWRVRLFSQWSVCMEQTTRRHSRGTWHH